MQHKFFPRNQQLHSRSNNPPTFYPAQRINTILNTEAQWNPSSTTYKVHTHIHFNIIPGPIPPLARVLARTTSSIEENQQNAQN